MVSDNATARAGEVATMLSCLPAATIAMKLATYHDGSRDGQLVVVSRDLTSAHYAAGIATRLQHALDDWNFIAPQLYELSQTLDHGKARHAFAFEPQRCMAPLPRAFQWAVSGVPSDRGEPGDPALAQRAGDRFLGPCEAAAFAADAAGIDFGATVAVVTGDVAAGASADAALEGVRLLMLANDWRLCEPTETDRAGGGVSSRPPSAFAPVAVTPDELGEAWRDGRVQLPLRRTLNGRNVGRREAVDDVPCHFGRLIARLARTRAVQAGSIVGCGRLDERDLAHGAASIATQRAPEASEPDRDAQTPSLRFGDRVRVEMLDGAGASVFGAIDQVVAER